MAWIQKFPSSNYHVSFRFGGQKFKRSLRTKSQSEAQARLRRLEENIGLIESGRLTIPTDADVGAFLLSDGKLNNKPTTSRSPTLGEVNNERSEGSRSVHIFSRATIKRHLSKPPIAQ